MNSRLRFLMHPENSLQSYFQQKIYESFAEENHYGLILLEKGLADLLYDVLETKKRIRNDELNHLEEDESILGDLLFEIRSKISELEQMNEGISKTQLKIGAI